MQSWSKLDFLIFLIFENEINFYWGVLVKMLQILIFISIRSVKDDICLVNFKELKRKRLEKATLTLRNCTKIEFFFLKNLIGNLEWKFEWKFVTFQKVLFYLLWLIIIVCIDEVFFALNIISCYICHVLAGHILKLERCRED